MLLPTIILLGCEFIRFTTFNVKSENIQKTSTNPLGYRLKPELPVMLANWIDMTKFVMSEVMLTGSGVINSVKGHCDALVCCHNLCEYDYHYSELEFQAFVSQNATYNSFLNGDNF